MLKLLWKNRAQLVYNLRKQHGVIIHRQPSLPHPTMALQNSTHSLSTHLAQPCAHFVHRTFSAQTRLHYLLSPLSPVPTTTTTIYINNKKEERPL